ncbi:hypothetical protein [Photorhabdus luminescens]|uniref:Uncharacterized protein n=1 Tax=Photorhabdus luminescens subsp. sonorensis TaxID=1173677 RepID=A0A5C4RKG9_PHOLU|nr:hypothetical protein [Photorhabdus luminescens]TNH44540.1 hypothetical protein EP164_04890 [Photorhabdus luminescens subsp. sonorensis]
MSAHNEFFPWMSYYKNYHFFETRMKTHDKVSNMKYIGDGLYHIRLSDGRILNVFICECYAFGVAEYHESVDKLGKLDAVIINSNWCDYSLEAKMFCMEQGVGLFKIGEFMAAINRRNYWEYLTKEQKEDIERKSKDG